MEQEKNDYYTDLKFDTAKYDLSRLPKANNIKGLLFYNLMLKTAFCHILERTPTPDYLSDAVHDFFNDERYKHYN